MRMVAEMLPVNGSVSDTAVPFGGAALAGAASEKSISAQSAADIILT